MKKHTFKELLEAARYRSFSFSVMPVIVTVAYLFSKGLAHQGTATTINFILCLSGVVVLHAAANLISDYFDFRSGAAILNNFEAKEYLLISMMLFVTGGLIGLFLVMKTGYGLLVIGALGVGLSILFSYLRFRALGDLDLFVVFSVLIILATSYCMTGTVYYDALILSVPTGAITVSASHARNMTNVEHDKKIGIRTFAMLIGGEASAHLYRLLIIVPFITVAIGSLFGYLHPLSLISFAVALPAYYIYKAARRFREEGMDCMNGMDIASSRLQFFFSAFLATGLFLSSFLD